MEEIDIWRAAKQMIDQHADAAMIEASMRAHAASAQGDMFNFDIWKRVAKAVKELERTTLRDDELTN